MTKETARAHLIETLRAVILKLEEAAKRREELAASESVLGDAERLRTLAKADRNEAMRYREQVEVLEEDVGR